MKNNLLILFTLFITAIGYSQTFTDNFITYQVTSPNSVKTNDYNTAGGTAVSIPSTVSNGGTTYTVTEIGAGSFVNNLLTSVIIPNSVTSIGNEAFLSNQLTGISFPNSLTTIGTEVFANNQLTSVIIPNSVTSIGNAAFQNNLISSLSISNSITSIGVGTFAVNQLTSVTIPNGVTSIGNFAFGNNLLTTITIPNNVTSIGNQAFLQNQLTSAIISNSVISIGDSAFLNNPMTSVTIGNSVQSIGTNAFNSNQLTTLTLPNSLITIGNSAFLQNQITSVIIPDNVTSIGDDAFFINQLSSVTIGSSVQTIGANAFRSNQLTTVTIPSSVTTIGDGAFASNLLTSIISEATTPPTITTGTNDTFVNRSGIDLTIPIGTTAAYVTDPGALWTGFNSVTENLFFVSNSITYEITSVTNNTVEATGYNAAGGTVVNIPASVTNTSITYSVTSIGSLAFENKSLTAVTLPSSMTSIGDAAFASNNLSNITIPSSVTLIGDYAFAANSLNTVTSEGITPPVITTVGNDTFWPNRNNIDLFIPLGTIGAYVTDTGALWTGFDSVTEVGDIFVVDFITYERTSIVDDIVAVIDYDVAGGTNVNIPATITDNSITYSVTTIRTSAFFSKQLTSVIIPNSITSIGLEAFYINQLTSVSIGNSVTSIGNFAFLNNQLTSVIIPNSVTSIGFQAFQNNPLVNVTSLATTPPIITTDGGSSDTFGNRSNIDLTIPFSTTGAYVTDSGALWTGFNTVTEALEVGDSYIEGFITYEVTSTIDNTVKAIDYNVTGGTVVNIPVSITNGLINYDVTEIGIQAFDNKSLTDITIPTSVININSFSFRNNQLTNLVVPNSVTNIGASAFEGNQLTNVTIPNSVTVIEGNSFAFNQLSSVTIPNSITNLDLGIFQHNQLTSVIIPDNIITIGAAAFENNQLTSITIPSNITNIGARAFKDNPLISITSEAITPPTIVTENTIYDSFNEDRSGIDLTIPAGTMGPYVTDPGALWTGFNSVIEGGLNTSDFELKNDIKIITTLDEIILTYSNNINLINYKIYSLTGAQVATGIENKVSTAFLARGIYVLKLDFDEGTIYKKVAIK